MRRFELPRCKLLGCAELAVCKTLASGGREAFDDVELGIPGNTARGRYSEAFTACLEASTSMGLKFNFRRIPLHWRLLVGLQLGISGAIMAYRQRVLAVKAKQQE